jgi:MATE family multidrug resistance protein
MYKRTDLSFKGINKLAIPAIIAGIAEPLLSITDTAIVGNVAVNPLESLAAVGISGSFIAALIWVLAQTRTAISATIGRYLGAKRLDEIMGLPAQIIGLNMILSVVIYVVSIFFSKEIFTLYNAQGLTLNYAVDYYNIRALGFPLTLFVFSIFGVFRGLQNTFWPMLISIVGVFLNIGLDFILVFGIEGSLEPMHIEGAAWASVISQLVMALMALILMLKKTPFNFRIKFNFHPELKNILQISMNLIVRAISLNVALIMANAYATKYGDAYIAAQTIAFQIWLFFAFFIDGYASVGNIVSGKLKGENNFSKIWILSGNLTKYAVIVSLVLVLVCSIFYNRIGVLFTQEEEVLVLFSSVFWIVLIMQPINALAFVFDGIFKGLAEAVVLRNLLLIATFLGFVPVLLIGDYFNLKLTGIWIAFTVWMLIRGGVLFLKFRRKYVVKIT